MAQLGIRLRRLIGVSMLEDRLSWTASVLGMTVVCIRGQPLLGEVAYCVFHIRWNTVLTPDDREVAPKTGRH